MNVYSDIVDKDLAVRMKEVSCSITNKDLKCVDVVSLKAMITDTQLNIKKWKEKLLE